MCGIAGFVGPSNPALLERMVSSLTHRGPDEVGYWSAAQVSLGMRRLSIVDLAGGQQPVFNEDRTVAVCFNGEIYNHRALRADLVARGHRFRSDHSDTEVIVHLYEEHGDDFARELNGMFAIALWDLRAERLLLVRDRVGIKPLYFAALPAGGLVFGSEPKAILLHPEVGRDPDFTALHHYFSLKNVPAPLSAFRAIRQLGAGELLVLRDGAIERRRWWRPRFGEVDAALPADAPQRLLALLEDAVRLQMQADVPFGAYLSGGVDSSAVVALMSRQGGGRVRTFTLTYDDDDLPNKDADRHFARQIAARFDTEHHERQIGHRALVPAIEHVVEAFDEPFSGVISTYFLTDLIADHVKVALSGDGADELFGSYAPHRLALPIALCDRPAGSRPTAAERAELAQMAIDPGLAERFAAARDAAAARMAFALHDDAAKQVLYNPAMTAAIAGARTEDLIRARMAEAGTGDPVNRMLHLDFETLLSDQVLPFVDRLSMAHSVEVRPPFLDHRLVEFANALPGSAKVGPGRTKHVLKQALRGVLPDAVLDRPKEGFLMPVNHWLARFHEDWVRSVLAPGRLARHGLLRTEAVGALVDGFHRRPDSRGGDRVWNLLMFQLWWERYIDR